MSKRLYSVSYFLHKPPDRPVWPHDLRDGTAFAEMVAFFTSRGYEYGGPLLNYPCFESPEKPTSVDVSFLSASDLLVLPTRPPIHDPLHEERRKIYSSNTTFEAKVFKALKDYFKVCSRTHMKLSKPMASLLEPSFKNRADIHFTLYSGAWYKEYKKYGAYRFEPAEHHPKRTAAYLVRINHLWENGPALLVAFGMGGVETLVWLYLLRRRYPALLETPGFVMAELEGTSFPKKNRPFRLDFAEEWNVNLLIEHVTS